MMNYKGYIGRIEFDDENEIFHGEVINTRDVITFQATNAKDLKKEFIESVENYLEFCAERNESPDKPFSGKFNLRLTPELHREAFIAASERGISLNTWVSKVVEEAAHRH
jgi:predicted HicB family RNase H-like nuclease